MIADSHFELRARLGTALFALGKVAEDVGLPPARAALLRHFVGSLRDPFLFVVAGEVNAGKSTFLNALFGEAFCEADVLPTTERIFYFKHAAEARDVIIDDSFVEVYRNIPFLRDFHIVDTPGTNSVAEGHQEITERFIPMADLVIVVFSATNPWGASTWDFVEQIYDGWLKNVIFVLQQSDLRSPDEVGAIVEHMRVTARRRLHRDIEVFPVSARQAFVAKTSAHRHEEMLRRSGFPALEDYISRMVVSTNGMRQKFRHAIHTARAIMAEADAELLETRSLLENDRRVLEDINEAIASHYRETRDRLDGVKQGMLDAYRAAADAAAADLHRGLGMFQTLFGRRTLVVDLESRLADETARAGLAGAEEAVREIERDLPALRQKLDATIAGEFRLSRQGADVAGTPGKPRAGDGFAVELAEHCRGALLDTESVEHAARLVASRRKGARIGAAGLLLGALASMGGILAKAPLLSGAGGVLAVLGALGLLLGMKRHGKAIRQSLRDRNSRAGESLERAITQGFTARMTRFYSEFLGLFEMVREFCEAQRSEFQPLLADLRTLAGTLAEIEAAIDPRERRGGEDPIEGPRLPTLARTESPA